MWKRFTPTLRCPLCASQLELSIFEETRERLSDEHIQLAEKRALLDDDFACYVDAGMLLCAGCKALYPIAHGLPVLLPYRTPLHEEFSLKYEARIRHLGNDWRFPARDPVPGERFVLRSFSTEWLEYDYDGVIWEMDYADHEQRFLAELGPFRPDDADGSFLEMGCGIGLTTFLAQRNFDVDAVGVDLSLAALRAAMRYRSNPFLHFVQGSVFYLPFAAETFDTVYSRGVLHHTYSTHEAFDLLAKHCKRGGEDRSPRWHSQTQPSIHRSFICRRLPQSRLGRSERLALSTRSIWRALSPEF